MHDCDSTKSRTLPAFHAAAEWLSELVSQNGSEWQEAGNVTLSPGNTFLFHSIGNGHSFNGADGSGYGGIVYEITGGIGMYEGASGVMVDTFYSIANATTFNIFAHGYLFADSNLVPTVAEEEA